MTMENAEEILQSLEEFSKRKVHVIPSILEDYLLYVAQTGDPVFQWTLVKHLIKEKFLCIIKDFHESNPGVEIPPCPNVDPFNFETMKRCLLERLDMFAAAPFTIQRLCELLSAPRKQYSRIDKFMRAMEKNILVVSTREPGNLRQAEYENGDHTDSLVNGSDSNSDYNVDVEMEDTPWKENDQVIAPSVSVDGPNGHNIETPMQIQDEINSKYESVTPPESDSSSSDSTDNFKPLESMEECNEETSIKLVSMNHSMQSEQKVEMKNEMCEIKAVIPENQKQLEEQSIAPTKEALDNSAENFAQEQSSEGSIEKTEKCDTNIEMFEESNSSNFSENTDSSSSDSDKITNHLQNDSYNSETTFDLIEKSEAHPTESQSCNTEDKTTKLVEQESFSDADIPSEETTKPIEHISKNVDSIESNVCKQIEKMIESCTKPSHIDEHESSVKLAKPEIEEKETVLVEAQPQKISEEDIPDNAAIETHEISNTNANVDNKVESTED